MLPDPLENFGQSLVATSLFSNNILLAFTSADYWGVQAIYKPLLHTWSLGVEEQYYVLFPVFLMSAWRFGKGRVFWIIVVMAVASLLLSEWGWRNKVSANFYLAPTRAWELFSGAIAAFLVQKNGVKRNNILSLIGLISVVFSIFFYDESMPFPSIYTLLPVVGVLLLILYADPNTFVAKFLSHRLFVGTGLISYSLYLWHQPVISFMKIYSVSPVGHFGVLVAIILTLFLSLFTWYFVEVPFRRSSRFSGGAVFSLSILSIVIFTGVGAYLHLSNGAPKRIFTDEAYERSTHERKIAQVDRFSLSQLKLSEGKNFGTLIFGDSFAADVAYLIKFKHPSIEFRLMKSDGLPQNDICRNGLLNDLRGLDVTSVVFAYDEGFDSSCIGDFLSATNEKGIEVLFVGTKQFGYNLNWLARLKSEERASLCQPPIEKRVNIDIRDSYVIPEENYFSFLETFSEKGCFPITNAKGELLSSDRQHFTISGLEYFSGGFFQDEKVRRVLGLER